MSYGYHRAEVIGAIISVFIIWSLTGILVHAAIHWIINPIEVDGFIMMITAVIGLIINLSMLKVLHSTPGGSHANCSHGHSHKKKKPHKHVVEEQKHLFKKEALLKIEDEEINIKYNVNFTQIVATSSELDVHSHHNHSMSDHEHHHHKHSHHSHAKTATTENVNVWAAFIHIIGDII